MRITAEMEGNLEAPGVDVYEELLTRFNDI